ncbi:ATP-binding protein, partial [Anaerolineales bacterium HSG6]|nr:ATP-binding protein [Anaerolineales bacterium HSG6]
MTDFLKICAFFLTLIMMVLAYVATGWFVAFVGLLLVGLVGLAVIALPIGYKVLMIELRYRYAHRDLDVQERQVNLDRERVKVITDSITKLEAGQVAVSPHDLKQIANLPQDDPTPAPIDGITNHSDWFTQAINALHLIVVGESGSGKSTLVGAVAHHRKLSGQVRIVDPHGRPNDWLGLNIVGSGRDYTSIDQYFGQVLVEMSRRYVLYDQGQNQFDDLTIIVDEVTSIAKKCDRWAEFFSDVSCEGRKVNIRL